MKLRFLFLIAGVFIALIAVRSAEPEFTTPSDPALERTPGSAQGTTPNANLNKPKDFPRTLVENQSPSTTVNPQAEPEPDQQPVVDSTLPGETRGRITDADYKKSLPEVTLRFVLLGSASEKDDSEPPPIRVMGSKAERRGRTRNDQPIWRFPGRFYSGRQGEFKVPLSTEQLITLADSGLQIMASREGYRTRFIPLTPGEFMEIALKRTKDELQLHINLSVDDGSPPPPFISILLNSAVFHPALIKEQIAVEAGVARCQLQAHAGPASDAFLHLTAAGFGTQLLEVPGLQAGTGNPAVIDFELIRPHLVPIQILRAEDRTAIVNARIWINGKSDQFRHDGKPDKQGVVQFLLRRPLDPGEPIRVELPDRPDLDLTVADLMGIPLGTDGIRVLLAPPGITLTGTVNWQDYGPAASIWVNVRSVDQSDLELRNRAVLKGTDYKMALTDDQGRFTIHGLRAGSALAFIGAKRAGPIWHSDGVMAPAIPLQLEAGSINEVTWSIPNKATTLIIRVERTNNGQPQRGGIQTIEVYALSTPNDGPYALNPADRTLLGETVAAYNAWMQLKLPPGLAESENGFLLRIGPRADICLERKFHVHGSNPRLKLTLTEVDSAENGYAFHRAANGGIHPTYITEAQRVSWLQSMQAKRESTPVLHAR